MQRRDPSAGDEGTVALALASCAIDEQPPQPAFVTMWELIEQVDIMQPVKVSCFQLCADEARACVPVEPWKQRVQAYCDAEEFWSGAEREEAKRAAAAARRAGGRRAKGGAGKGAPPPPAAPPAADAAAPPFAPAEEAGDVGLEEEELELEEELEYIIAELEDGDILGEDDEMGLADPFAPDTDLDGGSGDDEAAALVSGDDRPARSEVGDDGEIELKPGESSSSNSSSSSSDSSSSSSSGSDSSADSSGDDVGPCLKVPVVGCKKPGRIYITELGDRKELYAVCPCKDKHGLCRATRTVHPGKRKRQGRPLGFLAAWLKGGTLDGMDIKEIHRWYSPALALRKAARDELKDLPGFAAFAEFEREQRPGEASEPE